MTLARRTFLAALGAAAGSAATGRAPSGRAGGPDDLTFALWAEDAELAAFRSAAGAFEAAEGVRVHLQPVSRDGLRPTVDAALRAGRAPDVLRLPYTDLGAYRSRGELLDLTGQLGPGDTGRFLPAAWRAVAPDGRPSGVPHTLDTSVLVVRTDAARQAGIALPPSPAEAWSRDQLDEALVRLGGTTGDRQSATGVNWQGAGAHRWLNFLGQSGGRLLTGDLSAAAVEGPAGLAALRWTRSLFARGLVPVTTSTRGRHVGELFAAGGLASVFTGGSQLPALAATGIEFGVTRLPRHTGDSSELGGAALVATAGTPRAEQAARFLRFMASPDQVGRFCAATGSLPARSDLVLAELDHRLRPDVVEVLAAQAAGIPEDVVAQTTVPAFPALNALLGQQLERAFVGGVDAEDVLADLAAGIDRVLAA